MATIHVSDFGTSTANVQAAVNAAQGGTCIFASGVTYSLTGNIVVPANTRLEGNGCTLKYPNSSTTSTSMSSAMLKVQGSQVIIYGFTFDGNSTNQTTYSPNRHCVDITGDYNNVIVRNNTFTNPIGDGVHIDTSDHSGIYVMYNTMTANNDNRSGVTISSGTSITVEHNTFTKMARSASYAAINIEPSSDTAVCKNVMVRSNVIDGGSTSPTGNESGIRLGLTQNPAASTITIKANDITGAHLKRGVSIIGVSGGPLCFSTGIAVDSNNIHAISSTGFGVYLDNWIKVDSIASNTFNTMAYGIFHSFSTIVGTTTTGNTFTSVTNGTTIGSTSPQNAFNVVTGYNADPTGATTSTVEFQNCLNAVAAASANGYIQTMLVPPGTYTIDAYLQIKPPGNLVVSAYGATIKRANGAADLTLFKNYTGSTNYPGYSGPSNLSFRGGIYDDNVQDNMAGSQGISIAHSSNLLIEDITFQNVPVGHAVEVNSTQHAMVRNCIFQGFVVGTNNYDEACQIDGAFTSGAIGSQPWDMTVCDDVTVTGCIMREYNGLGAWGSLTGTHTGREGFPHTNITITDNYIYDSIHYGIKVMNWQNATIQNNWFEGCNGGISVIVRDNCLPPDGTTVTLTQNIDILDNTFVNTGNQPRSMVGPLTEVIRVHGLVTPYSHVADMNIRNNTIKGYMNTQGIMIEECNRITVENNRITDPFYTGQTPFVFRESDTVTLTGNNMSKGTSAYTSITNVTNYTATNNSAYTQSTLDEIMPIVSFAEDDVDRTTTSTTYADVAPLSCDIVVPESRKVLIVIQARQSSSTGFVATAFRISQGTTTIMAEEDDRCAQGSPSGDKTHNCTYVADFSVLNGGSVQAGDTITVAMKHRVASGATGTLRYRNIMLMAVNT